MTKDDYVRTVLSCISASNKTSTLKTNLILSIDRRNDLTTALKVIDLATEYRSQGVVGIDLCGDPASGDVSLFRPAFQEAKKRGLKITIHFAEAPKTTTPDELWTLLEYEPDRIGHVINVPDDVKEEIKRRKLGLELCLSCNVHANMITGTYGDHHFGVTVSLPPLPFTHALSKLALFPEDSALDPHIRTSTNSLQWWREQGGGCPIALSVS